FKNTVPFHLNGIGKTFLIAAVVVILISLAALGSALVAKNRSAFQSLMESRGKAMADLLGEISVKSFVAHDLLALEDHVKNTLKDPDVAFIVYYDSDKKPLTKNSEEPKETAPLFIQEREIQNPNGDRRPLGYLKLGYNQNALSSKLHSGILTGVIGLLALLALVILGAAAFARGITLPLGHLAEVVEKLEQGDFTAQVRPDVAQRSDAVGTLAGSFVKMSARLKGAIKKIQDVSRQITFIKDEALTRAEEARRSADCQADAAAKTCSSFNGINLSINQVAENIAALSSAAKDNSFSLVEMSAAIRQAADSTVTLSTSVEETAFSLSGMSGTIKEVAEHIDTLLLYAEEA